jgi:hypothetical protein
MMNSKFDLCLFSVDPLMITKALAGGISTVVVDWEWIGKSTRQQGVDTQINQHTLADLHRVRAATRAHLICRINNAPAAVASDIEDALAGGVDEILVPMVRTATEIEQVLDQVAGRCDVGILIETTAAVSRAADFAKLPLSRIYVGLNDLAIERRTPNLFTAVIDGTVESVRSKCGGIPFGFGGLTIPELGSPIPCRLLMNEMIRLDCSFTFLRRSFHDDVRGRNVPRETFQISRALGESSERSILDRERDHRNFVAAVTGWSAAAGHNSGAMSRAAA